MSGSVGTGVIVIVAATVTGGIGGTVIAGASVAIINESSLEGEDYKECNQVHLGYWQRMTDTPFLWS